jgi:hypothetical protein
VTEISDGKMCPSARCSRGAIFLGIVRADGKVDFAEERIEINQEFVKVANQGRSPERRFRFSNHCVQQACKQWKDNHCSVLDDIVNSPTPTNEIYLPKCSIRSQCRWFSQYAENACAVCPWIITNLLEETTPPFPNSS